MSMALSYMPKFFTWGKNLTSAILGENKLSMIYDFDGVKVYENISSADFGTMTAFLTSILFFLFTVVCGFIVVLTVHIYGMAKKGVWKYLKGFANPIFMLPVELIGQFSRTLSLSMRLFGNILSGDLIVAIVFSIVPYFLPIALTAISMVSGLLQAFVLTTLAALFISSAVEINEEDQKIKIENAEKRKLRKLSKKNQKGNN